MSCPGTYRSRDITADELVAQVRAFVDNPDLDTLRDADENRALYLSWLTEDRTVPKLALVVDLDTAVVEEAAVILSRFGGLELERYDVELLIPGQRQPGGWFSVVLRGPRYAHLPAESTLRCAREWLYVHTNPAVATEVLDDYPGDRSDEEYLQLWREIEEATS